MTFTQAQARLSAPSGVATNPSTLTPMRDRISTGRAPLSQAALRAAFTDKPEPATGFSSTQKSPRS